MYVQIYVYIYIYTIYVHTVYVDILVQIAAWPLEMKVLQFGGLSSLPSIKVVGHVEKAELLRYPSSLGRFRYSMGQSQSKVDDLGLGVPPWIEETSI